MQPTRATARIETERASRYLIHFCKHAASVGAGHLGNRLSHRAVQVHADCSDTRGVVRFTPWGECTITASADALTFIVDATSKESLRKIQAVITSDLERFGRRDGLELSWRAGHTSEASVELPDPVDTDGRGGNGTDGVH